MPKVFTTDELISNSTDIIDQWTIINENVYEIVNGVTQELDDYINGLPKNMTNLPDEELEGIIMEIPSLLYWVNSNLEKIGAKEDIAQSFKNKVFRESFLSGDGSVSLKKIRAEEESYNQELVEIIYSNAYKTIKNKAEMAFEIMQSAKKIMNMRVAEFGVSNVGGGNY